MMPGPFQPISIGRLRVANRFMRSATFDGTADDAGGVTDASVALYRALGLGGAGLIVTGFAFISGPGQVLRGQYGVHTDGMIPGLSRLVQAAHRGEAKIALQIVHGGIKSRPGGAAALAVSGMPDVAARHREMSAAKVEAILDDFAAAAGRAREAGFDGVQFHGAHGYLMNQFLSPLYNFRSDEWGGSAAGRQRFYLEVIRRARRAVGPDYPLMVKFGVQDDLAAGLTLGEGLELAGTMVTAGIDAIEVSSGADGIRLKKNPDHERANYRPRTAAVKRAVSGIRSLEMARSLMESGDADMVSMCRSFIRESGVVARWQTGDAARSPCIDCDKCTQGIARGVLPLECGEERRLREAAEVASGPLRPKE